MPGNLLYAYIRKRETMNPICLLPRQVLSSRLLPIALQFKNTRERIVMKRGRGVFADNLPTFYPRIEVSETRAMRTFVPFVLISGRSFACKRKSEIEFHVIAIYVRYSH